MRRTDTSITLEQDADSSAPALFALLADPRSHVQMDASGMLQATEDATVIDHVEQVFSMAMHYPSLGDYITDNRVVEFEPDRCLTWATGRRGQPPAGVRWGWQLTPASPRRVATIRGHAKVPADGHGEVPAASRLEVPRSSRAPARVSGPAR